MLAVPDRMDIPLEHQPPKTIVITTAYDEPVSFSTHQAETLHHNRSELNATERQTTNTSRHRSS